MKFTMTPAALLTTIMFITAGLVDLVLVELGHDGVNNSISSFMANLGLKSPFIILVVGFILGHFWGTMTQVPENK